jgi:hypothetical protein
MYDLLLKYRDLYAVSKLVDQDVISDQQRGLHGARRNLEGLDHKSPDDKGEEYGYNDGFRIFADQTFRFSFLCFVAGDVLQVELLLVRKKVIQKAYNAISFLQLLKLGW